jgi:hypothetical protein
VIGGYFMYENNVIKKKIFNDLSDIFISNTSRKGTDVHGVYECLKIYMIKLMAEIEIGNKQI